MRRTRGAGLCLVLIMVAGLAGSAQSAGRRVETGTYTAGGVKGVVGVSGSGQEDFGAVRFEGDSERFVHAKVEDASGRPIAGEVVQLGDAGSPPIVARAFCGKTERPVKVWPGRPVHVYVYYGQGCGGEVVSAPTRGTVTAVFTTSS